MRVLLPMRPANHLPLRSRLLRLVTGTCREIAVEARPGAQPSVPAATATRSPRPSRRPAPPHRAGLACCGQAGLSSDGLVHFARDASRKRPVGWRLLTTRASSEDGGAGGDITNGSNGSTSSNGNTDNTAPCWKCGSTVSRREYFCECGAAQPLDGRLDYFEMFGCPPSVFLELKEVENRFKNMQRAFHPVSADRDHDHAHGVNKGRISYIYTCLYRESFCPLATVA